MMPHMIINQTKQECSVLQNQMQLKMNHMEKALSNDFSDLELSWKPDYDPMFSFRHHYGVKF